MQRWSDGFLPVLFCFALDHVLHDVSFNMRRMKSSFFAKKRSIFNTIFENGHEMRDLASLFPKLLEKSPPKFTVSAKNDFNNLIKKRLSLIA